MHDLPFKDFRTIVTEAANELKMVGDSARQRRFNFSSARISGDERTDEEREQDFSRQRDRAAAALGEAERVLREYLARPR
jgi:hypothetical protein